MTDILNRRSVKAGAFIFRQGDTGHHAYVIQSGRVLIEKTNKDDSTVKLGSLQTGAIFGEMALVDDSPRMAAARAEEPTVLITIPKEVVQKKLQRADPVVRMLILMMIRMIRTLAEHGGQSNKIAEELIRVAQEDDGAAPLATGSAKR
ncbi:cyclic nucleotide-binding domain-containing protein [Hwanghaeella grinnelliae]|uniref:Cyclic nucleotide-binding domain-containing protein n=1 Tax=Hwanghaeella grinnelliae TaxID=2500179 RepID=A0A437QHZ9_9PROT|nr:cyclic nucleotide-binding domain-containing protein [Hwanghaeella grinnelliae]RVU34054.1 cyclic nucleotide-binding domain-containing protein [Hwanghaeella grinnelliae]